MLSEPFCSILKSGRDSFNNRFAAAKRAFPDLDPASFIHFLERAADPFVCAVHQSRSEQTIASASAAYDAGLELVGQGLVDQSLSDAWYKILVRAASIVSERPGKGISAVCNALFHLSTTPGARPSQWIDEMERLCLHCENLSVLLALGEVTAWRAGLAHFRDSAIQAAGLLPEALALQALRADRSRGWQEVKTRLLSDPWFDPSNSSVEKVPLRKVAEAGAFRGFGGMFSEPPEVTVRHNGFVVRSGREYWMLIADAFGATFHRTAVVEFPTPVLPESMQIDGNRVRYRNHQIDFPVFDSFSSFAVNQTTLACTSRLTHSVLLVALQ